jgi:hypothetical protein
MVASGLAHVFIIIDNDVSPGWVEGFGGNLFAA